MTAQQKRVLIVDDDDDSRQSLCAALRHRDLIVDEASDGPEALDLLKENAYAIVLLEVCGFAVVNALASVVSPPIVLAVTAADRLTLKQLDPRKIHGVVRKPFELEELANLVVACAEIRSRSAFETMVISAVIAGGPFLAWLNRFGG